MTDELTILRKLAAATIEYVAAREASTDAVVAYHAAWPDGPWNERIEAAEKVLDAATERHLKATERHLKAMKRLDAAITTYREFQGNHE